MTIESNLKRTADALEELVRTLQQTINPVVSVESPTVVGTPPVADVVPVTPSVAAPPVITPAAPSLPFTDTAGLIKYVMAKYNELGQVKGAKIQLVMQDHGYANVNDVKPEHFQAIHAAIEAL